MLNNNLRRMIKLELTEQLWQKSINHEAEKI